MENGYAAAGNPASSAIRAMEDPPIELTDDQVGDLVSVKNLAEVRLIQARAGVRRADHALTKERTAAAEKERADGLARVMALGTSAQKIARGTCCSHKGIAPCNPHDGRGRDCSPGTERHAADRAEDRVIRICGAGPSRHSRESHQARTSIALGGIRGAKFSRLRMRPV